FSSYTTVAGGNGNTNFAQENICNNSTQTYCNEFKFSDADTTDTLYFNYRYSLTNITFTNIGSATKPIIKVCYTPTLAELSTGKPLNFKIEVNDGKCPLPGTSELVFTYKVLAPLPDSFAIDKSLTCRDITLKAINNSSLPTSKFRMGWDIKNERDALPKYYNGDSITAKLDSGWNKIKLFAQDRNFGGASQPYCDRRIYEDSVYIDPILHIEINAGPDTTLCNDPVLPLNPAVSRGTAPFTYQWEDNSTSLPRVFNATRKNDTLQVTVTDSNNCRALDTVFVNYFNPRVTITGDTANCINSTIILNAGLSGITSPYHFEWVGFNALTVTIKPALSATTKYDFTLTDGSGCVVQASRTVTAYDPKVVPSHIASVCNKDSIHFTASTAGGMAPHTVSWPTFSQTGASVGIKADSAGIINYTVIVTDAFGCTSQETGTVTVHELPVLIPVYPMQVCAGDSISLSASINGGQAPYSINWSPFGLPGSSVKVSAPVAGPVNFTTEVTDSNGCKTSETGQVTVNALPVVIAASPGIICQSAQRVSLASFGTPAGGVWTGMNIAGDSLSTADTGLHALHYGYTDATTGCTNNDTTAAYVELQPVAGFSADSMKGPVSYVFNFTNTSTKAIYNTTHWDFGDPASGTANTAATVNAAHTFSDSGTYTVRLIISGGICDPDTEIQVITVYRPSTTSVKEKAGVTAKMYPNPARQEFTVEGENISGIRVTDLQGREIKASVTPLDKLRHNVRMDGVSPGMYLVQIIYSDQLVFVYNLVVTY
ncbi:MAG TPA: T9SS type A sorting domain-containing protein, partial [Bacteroidia bacterium]|nr:T9SS type A sorting domain-containing protein [Bacteroidia bacterium]